jgi:hypothetical protein
VDGTSFARNGESRFSREPPGAFQLPVNQERKIMSKEFSEQAVIDGALSDLLVAYELILEMGRHSSGENAKHARAAASLIDVCFQTSPISVQNQPLACSRDRWKSCACRQ